MGALRAAGAHILLWFAFVWTVVFEANIMINRNQSVCCLQSLVITQLLILLLKRSFHSNILDGSVFSKCNKSLFTKIKIKML